jgi:signal transduction histidine kinase
MLPVPYADIFVGNGEMAELMRRHDWASISLGPPERWPEGLKVALRLLLTSRFEMWLGWGPDIAFFYNDAYRPTLGIKHPKSLGAPTRVLWAEIWDELKDRIESVYRDGTATWDRALLLILERSGYPEETYHTFSYSPLLGDTGKVEGLFCAVSEETERVLSERRLSTLSVLASGLATNDSRAKVVRAAEHALAGASRDMPFTLIYLFDDDGVAQLAGAAGIARGHPLAPLSLAGSLAARWCADRIAGGEAEVQVSLDDLGVVAPSGPWSIAPRVATVRMLGGLGGQRPLGFMVAAQNPFRPGDANALDFVRLVAGQIGASFESADAYEAERRRLAAEVVARTEESDRLRSLFRQAPGFMCVLSGPDFVYELHNDSYHQLVGHRDLAGRTLRAALPELEGQGFLEQLQEVRRTGTPFIGRGMRVMLQRVPGAALEERFLNFVYQPIFASDGAVDGIFAEGADVTEQFRAERALIELNGSLETRIDERTNELAVALEQLRAESAEREAAQEALRQSQKMEAVGQLTGGIAHDFNNFLQGITGSLGLMRRRMEQGRTEEISRYIRDANNSAKRAAALTHRLLAFSRRQPLDPKPVDANPLVLSMEALVRRSLGERLSLELKLADGLWCTLCDPNQLESAVLNLCINARDAMPDGGTLTIATGNADLDRSNPARTPDMLPGEYVHISVSDDGIGMTPEILGRAFDPFFTTKPMGQGTGLGLSMIYGFARQSEGYAKIDSAPGRGTTVHLYLPRHRGVPVVDDESVAHPLHRAGGGTVLVVEDEAVVRGLVVEVLRELGYRTLEAADGPAGLEILMGAGQIDLLVTDIGLPGLNGRQVADAARLRRPGLKVLLMTGYAENATLAKGVLDAGMEMMTKPFAIDDLIDRVTQMMK